MMTTNNKISPVLSAPRLLKPLGTKGELHWVHMMSGDHLPTDAVIGGFDKGETVYVARANHNTPSGHGFGIVPGKYVPSLKRAVIGWGLRAHYKESFEILCGYNLDWVKTQGAAIPPNAFPGGLAPETNNEILYISRAKFENSLIPGKAHRHFKTAYITNDNLEIETHEYEALVVPDRRLAFLTQ